MKLPDVVRRAGRSLREAKLRTFLTSLAIAVGAFTVTLSLAAGTGTRDYTEKLIQSNVDEQLILIASDETVLGSGDMSGATQAGLTEYSENQGSVGRMSIEMMDSDDLDKIGKIKGIEEPKPVVQVQPKYLQFEGDERKFTSQIMMYGSGLVVEASAGSLPDSGAQLADDEMVVPESYLETINIDNPKDAVGKKVTITLERAGRVPAESEIAEAMASGGPTAVAKLAGSETKQYEFTIRAVTKSPSMAVMETLSTPQIPASTALDMYNFATKGTDYYGKYPAVTARVAADLVPEDVKTGVESAGYYAKTAKDFQSMIFSVVNLLQGIVIGFGVLALIASVFGVINTQYISVLERTQQIGLMKALGMRGRHVAKLFRYEAASLGLIGGVIGSAIAFAAGTAMNPWITEQLGLGEGNYLLVFDPLSIAILVVALSVVAIAAGYSPARKAAKLDPIEALRTE